MCSKTVTAASVGETRPWGTTTTLKYAPDASTGQPLWEALSQWAIP